MGTRIVKTLKVGKYYKLKPLFNIKPMKNYDGILLKTEFDWWCTEKIKTSHSEAKLTDFIIRPYGITPTQRTMVLPFTDAEKIKHYMDAFSIIISPLIRHSSTVYTVFLYSVPEIIAEAWDVYEDMELLKQIRGKGSVVTLDMRSLSTPYRVKLQSGRNVYAEMLEPIKCLKELY